MDKETPLDDPRQQTDQSSHSQTDKPWKSRTFIGSSVGRRGGFVATAGHRRRSIGRPSPSTAPAFEVLEDMRQRQRIRVQLADTPPLRAISTRQCKRSSSRIEWASGMMLISMRPRGWLLSPVLRISRDGYRIVAPQGPGGVVAKQLGNHRSVSRQHSFAPLSLLTGQPFDRLDRASRAPPA
jgi:hypothetical protein